jgi:transposase InsO family protein
LFSRRVVGWATSATNDRELALAALKQAVVRRKPRPGLIHHSDRGSPYTSDDYRRELRRNGIIASMSRKGDCWDIGVVWCVLRSVAEGADALVVTANLAWLSGTSAAHAQAQVLDAWGALFGLPTARAVNT